MYNAKSGDSNEFIDHQEILDSIEEAKKLAASKSTISSILEKAEAYKGLTHREAAVLLEVTNEETLNRIYNSAKKVKEKIYGKRIVIFAPLYLSNYCVNDCTYCGYKCSNKILRRQLSQEELKLEVRALEALGHKRLLLETGEDDEKCPIDYILQCIETIYNEKFKNGAIRRVNIDIAATTVENYKKLRDAQIGTYILFQETYHKPTYLALHKGPKQNYEWHTEAMDRAMQGGIDDVGIGPLYGLYEWRYETIATLMHAEHLEAAYGVGPHTISFPRLLSAENVDRNSFKYLVNDDDFKKIVAVTRLAVPYTGMILSTRESADFRKELLEVGISQISAGSCVGVGGYATQAGLGGADAAGAGCAGAAGTAAGGAGCTGAAGVAGAGDKGELEEKPQFNLADHRKPMDVIKWLVKDGYIPSYCTACYKEGRTGDRFMPLAKSGEIANFCLPNALLTFEEFLGDYADDELKVMGKKLIDTEMRNVPNEGRREKAIQYLEKIRAGERDLRF
ncbi:MAG: [FeFe] hydrogenase H-cluster radical SAM maturase HydG [Spirochaetes bacterium]|nr:[FeFe] hydrogenase H-cluster radical SAM maturase HydG [Spirochaetota bacterium]